MFRAIGAFLKFVATAAKAIVVLTFVALMLLVGAMIYTGWSRMPASPQPLYRPTPSPVVASPAPQALPSRPVELPAKPVERFVAPTSNEVEVKGHYRNGKWVAPHTRKKPTK